MNTAADRKATESVANSWAKHDVALAAWARKLLLNRTDAHGRYKPKSQRRPGNDIYTAKKEATAKILQLHFRGGDGFCCGLHTTSEGQESRWLGIDIDLHDGEGDPEANLRFALRIYDHLVSLGFRPLLFDSNGRGGYHVWVIFDDPIPSADAYLFGQWLIRDWQADGVAKQPETFPKQASIDEDGYGNWLRLPGRHHTHDHWTRVYDGLGGWLEGQPAIRAIVETTGTPASNIPAEALEVAPAGAEKRPGKGGSASGRKGRDDVARDARLAEKALDYLGNDYRDDYGRWLNVGFALRGLGEVGLGLWRDWSCLSPKYEPGCCEAKWPTMEPDDGISLGSLFKWAKDAGWPGPPKLTTRVKGKPHENNGHKANGDDVPPGNAPEATTADPGPNEADDDPHRLARVFVERRAQHRDGLTLRYWLGEWQRWDGAAYRPCPDKEVRAEVTAVIKAEFNRINLAQLAAHGDRDKPPKVRPVTTKLVGNVIQALAGLTLLGSRECQRQPAWLCDSALPADEILPARNALVHLPSVVSGRRALIPPTPRFFCPYALDYEFSANAPEPVNWLTFLGELPLVPGGAISHQLWPEDSQSRAALQEWMGLNLAPDTRYQKIGAIIGPKRSGKGTIARILTAMVGPENVANPTLTSLSMNFGLAPLIGKLTGIITDARLSGRSDIAQVVERLLSISGEDGQTIDRKHLPSWTGKLSVRFTLISNEIPRLAESSGALAGRMILLRLTKSFYGQEDQRLMEKLLPELPGILLWAIKGWRRLRDRGYFVQPESGQPLVEEMEDLSSPVGMFVKECCNTAPGLQVLVGDLFRRWKDWCAEKNREQVGDEPAFGRNLRSVLPDLETKVIKQPGKYLRAFEGIDIKPPPPPAVPY